MARRGLVRPLNQELTQVVFLGHRPRLERIGETIGVEGPARPEDKGSDPEAFLRSRHVSVGVVVGRVGAGRIAAVVTSVAVVVAGVVALRVMAVRTVVRVAMSMGLVAVRLLLLVVRMCFMSMFLVPVLLVPVLLMPVTLMLRSFMPMVMVLIDLVRDACENAGKLNAAERSLHQSCALVQRGNDSSGCGEFLRGRQVCFVQHDNVSIFNLLDKKLHDLVVRHFASILLDKVWPVSQSIELHVVRAEGRRVDHGHHLFQRDSLRDRRSIKPDTLKDLSDPHGLCNAAQLHYDVLEGLALLGEPHQVEDSDKELVAKRTTGAAILELNCFHFALVTHLLVLHKLRIDVDRGHVVDYDADPLI
mmetsp:Transcript_3267/g.7722  ORF Transcript_3267/g.7722 Transcript_3267/m.7722 type:complete len:361 (+) Transcript_3267:723-1805(+)